MPEAPSPPPAVALDNVSLHFSIRGTGLWPLRARRRLKAVDGVSFEVGAHEMFGIAGESGCGKSTLARMLVGLLRATSGRVLFEGRPLESYSKAELSPKIQMVFQDPYGSLNPRRTVGDIVGDPLVIHRKLGAAERQARVVQLLIDVGLSEVHYHRYPHEFSGGQRQRVAIARALALNPSVLVLDEPTSALDVSVQAVILNMIRDIKEARGLACLFITHDLNLMRFMTQRVAVMYLGRIVEVGPTEQVFAEPLHPYTRALMAATPQPDPDRVRQRQVLEGEMPSALNPPSGCPFHTRCPAKIGPICEKIAPALTPQGDRLVSCHLYTPPLAQDAP